MVLIFMILVLTGGNFTIENNINYLTPEELGVVNAPLANITGARSISGSMTCYLDNDAKLVNLENYLQI